MPERSEKSGREAAVEGSANEKILCGLLMKRYHNVSLVDLPLSAFDIIAVHKWNDKTIDFLRIQSKTAKKSVSFIGGSRGGKDRTYKSNVKTFIQSPEHSDCVVGVHFNDEKPELFFVPTLLIEKLGTKSISIRKVDKFKNNYEILDNCKNKKFILDKAREFGII